MQGLILTVTRQCNLRCSYCGTVKDGFPSLTIEQARRAVELFAQRYGGGDIKLFGGEPMLCPNVVRAAFEAARDRREINRVFLSTNGLGLTPEWLDYLRHHDKAVLNLSLDGRPADQRRYRRPQPNVADVYDHIMGLREQLVAGPRVVLTQTIAPAAASQAEANFRHLLDLGFRQFNFLPGYYLRWTDQQLADLERGFEAIATIIKQHWARAEHLHVRNLFTWAPQAFVNTAVVVDSDGSIHPSNAGMLGPCEALLERTRISDLDTPPTLATLRKKAATVDALLEDCLPPEARRSTQAVDDLLSAFCRSLYADEHCPPSAKQQGHVSAGSEPSVDQAPAVTSESTATPWIGPDGQRLERLELHLSYTCPTRCPFCSEGHRMKQFRRYPVSYGRVTRVLRIHIERGVRSLHLTGGEPTIHHRFVDVVRLAKRLGLRTSVGTIGTMLSREDFAEQALPHLDEILFSLHGPNALVHDQAVARQGSFVEVTRAMELARSSDAPVGIYVNTVVTRQNIDVLGDTVALAGELGASLIVVSNMTPEGYGLDNYPELVVPLQKLGEVLPSLPERAPDAILRFFGTPMCLLGPHTMLSNDLHWDPRVTVEWVAAPGKVVLDAIYTWSPDRKRVHAAECQDCSLRGVCMGVFDRYDELYPTDALRPVRELT